MTMNAQARLTDEKTCRETSTLSLHQAILPASANLPCVFFWGHTYQCSEITSDSVLYSAEDLTSINCMQRYLFPILSLWLQLLTLLRKWFLLSCKDFKNVSLLNSNFWSCLSKVIKRRMVKHFINFISGITEAICGVNELGTESMTHNIACCLFQECLFLFTC